MERLGIRCRVGQGNEDRSGRRESVPSVPMAKIRFECSPVLDRDKQVHQKESDGPVCPVRTAGRATTANRWTEGTGTAGRNWPQPQISTDKSTVNYN